VPGTTVPGRSLLQLDEACGLRGRPLRRAAIVAGRQLAIREPTRGSGTRWSCAPRFRESTLPGGFPHHVSSSSHPLHLQAWGGGGRFGAGTSDERIGPEMVGRSLLMAFGESSCHARDRRSRVLEAPAQAARPSIGPRTYTTKPTVTIPASTAARTRSPTTPPSRSILGGEPGRHQAREQTRAETLLSTTIKTSRSSRRQPPKPTVPPDWRTRARANDEHINWSYVNDGNILRPETSPNRSCTREGTTARPWVARCNAPYGNGCGRATTSAARSRQWHVSTATSA